MSGIFISYRRQDAAAYAGRLRADLARRYGEDDVFLDLADLAPGADWTRQLHQAVAAAELVLVVMGPHWAQARDPDGNRRLDDPQDFIRSEVAAALRMDKRVVPVLVGGADMPSASDLPDDVQGLVRRQAIELHDRGWDADVQTLVEVVDRLRGGKRPAAPEAAAPRAMTPPFFARLGQAIDILLGRSPERNEQAAPPPRPPPAKAPRPDRAAAKRRVDPHADPGPVPAHKVFVSYSNDDRGMADEVVQALEADGLPCWIAHRDIPPGVPSWAEPIVTAIANSRLVLVLLTARSIASVEVLREVTLAADEKIPLLPASLDDTPLSPGLRYFFVAGQRLDLAPCDAAEQVRRIATAAAGQLPVKP